MREQGEFRDARPRVLRRGVVILPSGLTLANLFCGIFAIVSASRGMYDQAGTLIVLGGVADALDGRVARATGSGSRFGAELDSLVDVISFGLAPAMIMYFAVLNKEGWDWLIVFLYVTCASIRLARFNVEQAGRAKRYFHGLPSPAAGLTLATYYWFSQTPLYNETVLGDLPWHFWLRFLMLALGFLMISNVSYPAVPTVGYKKFGQIMGSLVVAATIFGVIFLKKQFYFPALLSYVGYGVGKTVLFGFLGRQPRGDIPVISDDDEEIGAVMDSREISLPDIGPEPRGTRRRKRRRYRSDGDSRPPRDIPPKNPGEGGES
ncbi:MAG TPA: CDP-diacylglycerol--serine O-phosphatidyltransferase [Gemmatimonadaceae bacterium]|nr:CDP-diacylglycerol--serine O-phosphatidyltransferase [Gemmatimonadaceae bacterium]